MANNNLHEIQQDILVRLMRTPHALSFSQLLPYSMRFDSDKFNYHLKYLIKTGFVSKKNGEYTLTTQGLRYISLLTANGAQMKTFRSSVILVVLRNGKSEILLQKRKRHPFYGDINNIAGKIRLGEEILQSAKRKLKEAAGLRGQFKHVGTYRKIKINATNEILEDVFYQVCVTEEPEGKLENETVFGSNFWAKSKELHKYLGKSTDVSKKYLELLENIVAGKQRGFFFLEERAKVKEYSVVEEEGK